MGYKRSQKIKDFLKKHAFNAFRFYKNATTAANTMFTPTGKRRRRSTSPAPIRRKRRRTKFISDPPQPDVCEEKVPALSVIPSVRILALDVSILAVSAHAACSRPRMAGATTVPRSIPGKRVFRSILTSFCHYFSPHSIPPTRILFAIDGPYCMRPTPKQLDDQNRQRSSKTKLTLVGNAPTIPFTDEQFPSLPYINSCTGDQKGEIRLGILEYYTRKIMEQMAAIPDVAYDINQGVINEAYCFVMRRPGQKPVVTPIRTTSYDQDIPEMDEETRQNFVHVGEADNIVFGQLRRYISQPNETYDVVCMSHDTDFITYSVMFWYVTHTLTHTLTGTESYWKINAQMCVCAFYASTSVPVLTGNHT